MGSIGKQNSHNRHKPVGGQEVHHSGFYAWQIMAINALLMAIWRRQPKETVMVHSDQGSQYSSYDW